MKNLKFAFLATICLAIFFSSCSEDYTEGIDENETIIEHIHDHRTCGHTDHMEKLLQDPKYKEAYILRMENFEEYHSEHLETRALCNDPVTIPVAVHYQGVSNPSITCLTSLAEEAVDGLNADMQGLNSDISNWTNNASGSFPGVSHGETCVEFVLADTNHPSGYGLNSGDLAVTVNQTTSDSDPNWSGYLNIFVIPNTGLLGYAPLGGAGNGDGVVIDAGAFGTGTNCNGGGSSAPFDLGRTLTHEVGHYLLLDHIWGDGCGTDDGISDTPSQNSDYSGCPNIGASSCGSTDMHMNYMDYTNDACMYMLTNGQSTVMENYIASNLSILTNNASNVITGNGGGGGGGGGSTCSTPSGQNVQVLSSSSVKVTWNTEAQASNYQIRYRVTGTNSWTASTTTSADITLTGLTASTTYQYQLRTSCPSGWTGFTTTATFTTNSSGGGGNGGGNGGGSTSCDKPGFSSVAYVSTSRSKATWESMPSALRYRIAYRTQGTSSWTTKTSTTNEKNLFNLVSGATYEYRVRTKCPSGWTSYTAIETFVQSSGGNGGGNGGGGGNGSCSDNTISFELTLDNYGSETTWELIDANTYQVVSSGGPYSNNQSGTKKTKTFCIPDGCYTLYVDDSYGDGICCSYGNGSFELFDVNDSSIGYSNGNFGYYDQIDFCVTNNVATFEGENKDAKAANLKAKTMPNNG